MLDANIAELAFNEDAPRGSDKPGDRVAQTRNLRSWNEFGGTWGDGFADMDEATSWGGLRAPNHYHDPTAASSGGYTGSATPYASSIPLSQFKT